MGTIEFKYGKKQNPDGFWDYTLSTSDFKRFDPSLLALGDISRDGEYFEALAAIFDLEAFTSFCNQIDPHLVIPEFLNAFVNWLFQAVAKEFVRKVNDDEIRFWCQLPFFAKFMGDGVLFLWNTSNLTIKNNLGNIVIGLSNICQDYIDNFRPSIKTNITRPPTKLRCGIARGQVISLGAGSDFVGPCINVASRLQKLGRFSFAFSRRGFGLEKYFAKHRFSEYVLIKCPIRGVGDEELVYVRANEFNVLSVKERKELLP